MGLSHNNKELVNNVLSKNQIEKVISNLKDYKSLELNQELIMDIEKIAIGAFSPINGFFNEEDYLSVLNNKRLSNGSIWTLPIILTLNKSDADNFKEGEEVILKDPHNNPIALFKSPVKNK